MTTRFEELWKHIHAARKGAGMTQRELASRIGVSPQAVGQWEKAPSNGGILPGLKRVSQLEAALKVNFGDIELPSEARHRSSVPHVSAPHDDNLERRVELIEIILHANERLLTLLEAIAIPKKH